MVVVHVFNEDDERVRCWIEFRYEGVLHRNGEVIEDVNGDCDLLYDVYDEVNASIESKITKIQARLKKVMPLFMICRVWHDFMGVGCIKLRLRLLMNKIKSYRRGIVKFQKFHDEHNGVCS